MIRNAQTNEVAQLDDIAIRSKSSWGYDSSFINNATADLALDPVQIENKQVFVYEVNDNILGYYAFSNTDQPEMTALFVEPKFIGSGIGLKLWQHSIKFAFNQGWNKFKIIADPFAAEKFYFRLGCKQIGEIQSPVTINRKIPLLEYDLAEGSIKTDELFHVSESSKIEEFVPLPPPNKAAVIECNGVWAISKFELANYLLPRDCPRVCYRETDGRKIISVEEKWMDTLKDSILYLYKFDPSSFLEVDPVAGYWISKKSVKPMSINKIDDINRILSENNVTLRVFPNLHEEKNRVVKSYKRFSVIRFRNAIAP